MITLEITVLHSSKLRRKKQSEHAVVYLYLGLFTFLGQTKTLRTDILSHVIIIPQWLTWLPARAKLHLFMFISFLEEFQSFVGRLPTHYAVNKSVVEHLWRTDGGLLQRYRQLETTRGLLLDKARHTANKLFSLIKRCRHQPRIVLHRERYRVFFH